MTTFRAVVFAAPCLKRKFREKELVSSTLYKVEMRTHGRVEEVREVVEKAELPRSVALLALRGARARSGVGLA